jgi:hypothetical protein
MYYKSAIPWTSNIVHTDNWFNKTIFNPLLPVSVATTNVSVGLYFHGPLHTINLHASQTLHDNYILKNVVVLTTINNPKYAINFILKRSELQTTPTLSRNTLLPPSSCKGSASLVILCGKDERIIRIYPASTILQGNFHDQLKCFPTFYSVLFNVEDVFEETNNMHWLYHSFILRIGSYIFWQ